MSESQEPTKKALREELKRVQAALKAAEQPAKYPSVRRTCKYCKCNFNTPPTYNGSQMQFCKPAHRKSFDKEGEKPIDVILRKQERRMRAIAREEVTAALDRFATITMLQVLPKLLDRCLPTSFEGKIPQQTIDSAKSLVITP